MSLSGSSHFQLRFSSGNNKFAIIVYLQRISLLLEAVLAWFLSATLKRRMIGKFKDLSSIKMSFLYWGKLFSCFKFLLCGYCQNYYSGCFKVGEQAHKEAHTLNSPLVSKFLVSKETVVLGSWESKTWKFWFIKWVDRGL